MIHRYTMIAAERKVLSFGLKDRIQAILKDSSESILPIGRK